jgi:protein SCO1/2
MNEHIPRTLLAAILAGVVAAVSLGCGGSGSGGRSPASGGGIPGASALPASVRSAPDPRIRLTAARGGTFDTHSLAGKPYVVTFLYTHCPDVCPLIASEIRQALANLGRRSQDVAAVAVSVDPAHDTAEQVQEFLHQHHEPSNFHYLIGTRQELKPVWKSYFAAPQVPGDPESSHTASVCIIDAHGHIAGHISAGVPFDPKELSDAFTALLQGT